MKSQDLETIPIGDSPRKQESDMSTQPRRGSGSETAGPTGPPDNNTGIPDVSNPRVGRIEWRPENHPMM
jgi:hypothetical protein